MPAIEDQELQQDELDVEVNDDDSQESVESEEGAESQQENEDGGGAEEESVVVSIGDEEPAESSAENQPAPAWVKDLRKQHREAQKRIRELESALQQGQQQQAPAQFGKKPTLEDYDYDADQYEEALAGWFDQKRKVEAQQEALRSEQEKAQRDWQERLQKYTADKAKLKVEDFDEAEAVVQEVLDQTQQSIIIHGSDNPALLVAALGKNPAKAKELAAIKDPVKYAFALAKLETQLKVTQRKPPQPERTVSRSGNISGAVDSALDRLRAEAERTGDYSKVIAYKRNQKK